MTLKSWKELLEEIKRDKIKARLKAAFKRPAKPKFEDKE